MGGMEKTLGSGVRDAEHWQAGVGCGEDPPCPPFVREGGALAGGGKMLGRWGWGAGNTHPALPL
jgi:hypothetical protein